MKYKALLRRIGRIIYEFLTTVNLSKRSIIERTTVLGKRPKMHTIPLIAVTIIVTMLSACSFPDANIEIEHTDATAYIAAPNDEHQLIPSKDEFEASLKWDENIHIESNKDWLKSVSFISSKIGFISLLNSSSENCLLKTTDGGYSWETVNSCKNLYAICFISNQTGYAIENLGDNNDPQPALVKTVNGGVDWDVMTFIKGKNPVEINCINESIVFVAASNNTNGLFGGLKYEDSVFVSIDGASTWQEIQTPKEFYGEGMSWISLEEGYLMDTEQPGAGMQPKILYHTANGGKSWEIIAKSDSMGQNSDVQNALPIGGYPNGIKFFKSGTGYIGSLRAVILKTTNMGKTFSSVSFNDNSDVRPVPCFISENEGYAISANSKLVHTIDGGNSWLEIWP